MIKVILIVLGSCIIPAIIITIIINFIKEIDRLSDLYESMSPPNISPCIELTADQYILFHELYPKNFLLEKAIYHKYLIYISDKSYEEFEQKKKERRSPNYEYIKLKTPRDCDKVDKYFKNKKEQEEKAKRCAVQAEFLKDMKAKTTQEVEKANKTIKTTEDVFKTILNQTEKS